MVDGSGDPHAGGVLASLRRPLLAVSVALGLTGSGAALIDGPDQSAVEVVASGDDEVLSSGPTTRDEAVGYVPGSPPIDGPSTTTSEPATTPRPAAPKPGPSRPTETTEPSPSTTTPTSVDSPATLAGRVTDRSGNPVPGLCFFSAVPTAKGFHLGGTDSDGRYRISPPPFGGVLRMCDPSAFTFGWGSVALPPYPSTGHAVADFVVGRLGAVRGQVVEPDGSPVPGVCVHVVNAESVQVTSSALGDPVAVTGPDGRFAQPNVHPGKGAVWVNTCDEAHFQLPWTATPYEVVAVQWSETVLTLTYPYGG